MKSICNLLLLLSVPACLLAQGINIPAGADAYHIMERLEIKSGIPAPYHSALKPWLRGEIVQYALQLDSAGVALSDLDKQDLQYLFDDNHEWLVQPEDPTTIAGERQEIGRKVYVDSTRTFYTIQSGPGEASQQDARYRTNSRPLLKYFYKTPPNFFEIQRKHFHFILNPLLNFKVYKDQYGKEILFHNQRGLEIRGNVDDRVYYYTNILESQSRFADYVNDRIDQVRAIPGAGLYKKYRSSIFNSQNGYDYLQAQGYIGFNVTKHIGIQFGHGRNFIGNGYRSMLLSDFGNNYFYLKINTHVGKFHYQNLFAELSTATGNVERGVLLPKKYMAAHYLSYNLTPRLTLAFYEAVMFHRTSFELQYLNPVILYRTVEGMLGSPDNVLIGLDGKWTVSQHVSFYGQLMIDEFNFRRLIKNDGWWGNKFGVQAGLKYIDVFGIDHLDFQMEFNLARPYTYSHRDTITSYSHYHMPLAHPLGANFREGLVLLCYQPLQKLSFDARMIYANFGEDADSSNWGGNILVSNDIRERDLNNRVGQGVKAKTLLVGLDASYQIYHNMYIDLQVQYRRKTSDDAARNNKSLYYGGGVRINLANVREDF